MTGCDDPALTSQFHPGIDVKPAQEGAQTQADQPAGLNIGLDFPQSNDPTDLSTAFDPSLPQAPEPKDITVKLPAGVSLSPATADGLERLLGSRLATRPATRSTTTPPNRSPAPMRRSSARRRPTTPLLARRDPVDDAVTGPEPIRGDVYLIKPHPGDLSPSGDQDGTFRLLIQLESARYGINFKLPGTAVADKATGQLTATFPGNPQLPASTLERRPQAGPTCPAGDTAYLRRLHHDLPHGSLEHARDPGRDPVRELRGQLRPERDACANSPAGRPFSPTLNAGTESAAAGQSSPFVLNLEPQGRRTGAQHHRRDHAEGLHRRAQGHPLLL